jgi:hypothetical protein
MEACFALGWVTPDDQVLQLPNRISKFLTSRDPRDAFIAACYAQSLIHHPSTSVTDQLIAMLGGSPSAAEGAWQACGDSGPDVLQAFAGDLTHALDYLSE